MIVRRLEDMAGTPAEVTAETWTSRRFLLRRDGVGFSMHDTVLRAGTETHMWYANHIEAVYVIAGEGELEDKTDGRVYPLSPGTLYALNGHEKHAVRAFSDLRTVCVFNPPLSGRETHDADGVYPLIEDAAE